MTPDSPVAALWPDGAGGLTGKRAQKRLASAGIATVDQLRDMDADDLLAIPRSAKGVLAETRRALAANGLHLALDPAPSPASQREAREAGQAAAQRAGRRERARREDDPPVTAEDFAALAADLRTELAEADGETRRRMLAVPRREDPASFQGRPWVWAVVGPAGAAKVTGYTASSIRAYKARAAQERTAGTDTHRTMPAPDKDGKWVIGDLAMWTATRNEEQAAGYAAGPQGHREERRGTSLIPQTRKAAEAIAERDGQVTFLGLARELGVDYRTAVGRAAMAGIESDLALEHAGDEDVSAFLKARLGETRRNLTFGVLIDALHEAGIPALKTQVRRLLPDLRAAARMQAHRPVGTERARGESLHPQGWLYAAQVAEDWGVNPGAISAAIARGDIRVAERSYGRVWTDPARLRARTDRIRTPVDKDHSKARKEPGDAGYGEGQGQ